MQRLCKFLLICAFCLTTYSVQAGVRFITDVNYNSVNDHASSRKVSQIKQKCMSAGYTLTSCPSGKVRKGFCPSSPRYFKECCDAKYRYSKSHCKRLGLKVGKSCGGYYTCE